MSAPNPTINLDSQRYLANLRNNKPRNIRWLQKYIFLKIVIVSLLTLATGFVVLSGRTQLAAVFFTYAIAIIYNIAVYKAVRDVKHSWLIKLFKFFVCLATCIAIIGLLLAIVFENGKALHFLLTLPFNILELYLIYNAASSDWFHRFSWFYEAKNNLA